MTLSTKVLKQGEFKLNTDTLICENTIVTTYEEAVDSYESVPNQNIEQTKETEELKQKLKDWKEEAFILGRKEGYLAGYNEAMEECEQRVRLIMDETQIVLKQVMDNRNDVIIGAEQELVELAVTIAERIIDREIDMDKGTILRTVKKALHSISQRENLAIRVCPRDVMMLREADLLDLGISDYKLVEDPNLRPGDCIIDCSEGRIDATINAQLHMIAGKLGVGTSV